MQTCKKQTNGYNALQMYANSSEVSKGKKREGAFVVSPKGDKTGRRRHIKEGMKRCRAAKEKVPSMKLNYITEQLTFGF